MCVLIKDISYLCLRVHSICFCLNNATYILAMNVLCLFGPIFELKCDHILIYFLELVYLLGLGLCTHIDA